MLGYKRLIKRILAIASGGGHWVELQRLSPAFENLDVVYASVYPEYANDVPGHRFYSFRDVSRWDRFGFVVLFIQLLRLLLLERPKIVITTGSLPCCIALIWPNICSAQRQCGSIALPMFNSYRLPEGWPASSLTSG